MMETSEMHERLNDLMRLDVDAIRAYVEAIERIEDTAVKERLSGFMRDHQRHVDELGIAITDLGGAPEEPKPDFKGYLIEGMTRMRAALGDEQALKAMHQNEEITNRTYRRALDWDLPTDVREVVSLGYADEQRHIAYIEEQLTVRTGSSYRSDTRGGSAY